MYGFMLRIYIYIYIYIFGSSLSSLDDLESAAQVVYWLVGDSKGWGVSSANCRRLGAQQVSE